MMTLKVVRIIGFSFCLTLRLWTSESPRSANEAWECISYAENGSNRDMSLARRELITSPYLLMRKLRGEPLMQFGVSQIWLALICSLDGSPAELFRRMFSITPGNCLFIFFPPGMI